MLPTVLYQTNSDVGADKIAFVSANEARVAFYQILNFLN